ncbi:MAG: MBL fold metallo-hydrolase [Bacteroidales bacterium]|jgi:7,8-dihydropterin-6-yl-methyl-4-(beta-D-ribofuranosyl)aminobenzene 5'-phosphate synthase|nr:MBL fold metallo-hydrolase [Bacteroidales bacterium]
MKISVLTENTASGKFLAEHGLSYTIEHEGKQILFDTGHTDVFLKNAWRLNIDMDKIKTVVLSHGHWDHANGLKFLERKQLVCHPEVFHPRFRRGGKENIGIGLSLDELKQRFSITTTRKPYPVTHDIIFLGEIPRINSFEAQTTPFVYKNNEDDFVIDDSGIVVKLNHGQELVLISGCAHSGICNMIEYARKITGINKFRAVIGGFHLKKQDDQTQKTIDFLKDQDIQEIYPSHCTELPALCAFYNVFKIKHLRSGMELKF